MRMNAPRTHTTVTEMRSVRTNLVLMIAGVSEASLAQEQPELAKVGQSSWLLFLSPLLCIPSSSREHFVYSVCVCERELRNTASTKHAQGNATLSLSTEAAISSKREWPISPVDHYRPWIHKSNKVCKSYVSAIQLQSTPVS